MTHFRRIKFLVSVGLGFLFLICCVGTVGAAGKSILKAQAIEEKALEYLKGRISFDPDTTEITVFYEGKDIAVPPGQLKVDFSVPGRVAQRGRFPVKAKITVDRVFQKNLRLIAKVVRSVPLVTTRHPVHRGEILTAEDVLVEMSQSNRHFKHAVTRLEDAVGFEVVRNLGAGRVVTVNALRKPPVVEKGDQVTIVAQKGVMKITAPGLVKETGFANSIIQVVNLQTKKTIYGQVVNSQTVKVNF